MTNEEAKNLTLEKQVVVTDPATKNQVTGTIKDLDEGSNGNVTITVEHTTVTLNQFAPADVTTPDVVTQA